MIMKKQLYTAILLLAGIAFFSACKKYEEGPGLSLLPKKMRLTEKLWASEEVIQNGIKFSPTEVYVSYSFKKSGGFEKYESFNDGTVQTNQYTYFGDWYFSNDKETIYLIYESGYVGELQILRLTNKELWVNEEYTASNGNHYLRKFKFAHNR